MRITNKLTKEANELVFEICLEEKKTTISYWLDISFLSIFFIYIKFQLIYFDHVNKNTHTTTSTTKCKKKQNTIICNVNKNNLIILDVTTLVFWFGLVFIFLFLSNFLLNFQCHICECGKLCPHSNEATCVLQYC